MRQNTYGSEEVIGQLPQSVQTWIDLERFHLHRIDLFQMRERDPSFDQRYLPQNCGAFSLPCYLAKSRHFFVYGSSGGVDGPLRFWDRRPDDDGVLFSVHPTCLSWCRDFLSSIDAQEVAAIGERLWAVPTSSTRTLLVWPDGAPERAALVKTSLRSPMFGDRRLHLKTVAGSVGRSLLVDLLRPNLPASFCCFYEPLGFVPRRMQDHGMILRLLPAEILDGSVIAVPMFALLSGGLGGSSLLVKVLERSGMDARQFAEDVLCAPFASLWLDLAMRHGLLIEAHAQDLLLALAPDLMPLKRFYYRDFEGLQVDWELRTARGFASPQDMPNEWSWHDTYVSAGVPHSQLAWYKFNTSLFNYLHFVLHEFETTIKRCPPSERLLRGPLRDDEITLMFSRAMRKAIEDLFGVRTAQPIYNIYREFPRFCAHMMKVRLECMTQLRNSVVARRAVGKANSQKLTGCG